MARITTSIIGIFAFLQILLTLTLPALVDGAPNPAPAPLGPPETNPAVPNHIDNSIPTTHHSNPHIHSYPSFQSTLYPRISFSPSNFTNSTNSTTSPQGQGQGGGNQGTHYHYCDPGDPPVNALSDASPLISDCRALIADIDNVEWSYKWISCRQHALVSHGTCVFGIETVPDDICFPWTTLETGNGDIIDWISESIEQWGENDKGEEGKVGTWGTSQCHNTGRWRDDYLDVKWGVYHSG